MHWTQASNDRSGPLGAIGRSFSNEKVLLRS
jgi:hypothetical protein